MLYYLSAGILLGLTAGFSPGPLLTLVVSETLEHGVAAGMKVALAPIVTDAPIIAVTVLVLTRLSGVDDVLGVISLLGGGYVFSMGYHSLRQKTPAYDRTAAKPKSLTRGILANALSPHPYLFWLSVGAPTIAAALRVHRLAPVLFIGAFYFFLVGAKILLAVLVGRSRSFLSERGYGRIMTFLGLALMGFAAVLFADGLRLLGILTA